MTPNLEGGLVGCLSMVRHVIPHLNSDSTLMNELSDSLLARVIFPALHIATSTSLAFASAAAATGQQAAKTKKASGGSGGGACRRVLLTKLLDLVYLIGLRIGEEMARAHLTPVCTAFFAAFDKAYGPDGKQPLDNDLGKAMTPDLGKRTFSINTGRRLLLWCTVCTSAVPRTIYSASFHLFKG